jgi:F420-dependent oxidoreductase-like protein
MGRGLALGIGASHESQVTGIYGLGYDHPGRNTEEYATILAALLRGESVNFDGVDWTTHAARPIELSQPVSLLLAAMAPRMLRVAGAIADGTITFLAQAAALESHIVPKIRAAAATAGRGEPRVIAGLPVAVHDDEGEARAAIAGSMGGIFDALPNYQRVLAAGGCDRTADAAIVGDKRSVQRQLQRLIDAGATDIWASPFPVGNDPQGSLRRTRDALMELLD